MGGVLVEMACRTGRPAAAMLLMLVVACVYWLLWTTNLSVPPLAVMPVPHAVFIDHPVTPGPKGMVVAADHGQASVGYPSRHGTHLAGASPSLPRFGSALHRAAALTSIAD